MVRFAYLMFAVVCGCSAGINEDGGKDDALLATVKIDGIIGQGVLVKRSDSAGEHVYFLTARHVATSPWLADTEIQLKIGRRADCPLSSERTRWMTLMPKMLNGRKIEWDLAWTELTADECDKLREREALNAIPLDEPGTVRLLDCHKQVMKLGARSIETEIVFLSGPRPATIQVGDFKFCNLKNQHNRILLEFDCLVAGALCEQKTIDGDSGGAVFIREDAASPWKLAGLDIGYVTEQGTDYTTVCPLDPFLDALRDGTAVRLIDRPEVW